MICIIPARKNSKGIRNKNLVKIKNIHLIEYSIKFALKLKFLNKIYISTDDDRIIKKYTKYHKKLKVLKRQKKLATDFASALEVYNSVLLKLIAKKEISKNENFCSLLPTSPIRELSSINKAYKRFIKLKPYSLISVNIAKPKEWVWNKTKRDFITKASISNFKNPNRQMYKKSYIPNGNFYFFMTSKFLKKKKLLSRNTLLFEIKKNISLDIDDYEDLKLFKKMI